jgi:nitrogen fixation/metabolism regulation signal transduction histidine kinase
MQTDIQNTAPSSFSIENYKRYEDVQLDVLDTLPFSVYIIDYDWVYLFLNKNSIHAFGKNIDKLIGQSALEAFKDVRFEPIFEKIKYSVETKTHCYVTMYSPLRGAQVNIKGYSLEDCYCFSSTVMPSKEQVLGELRGVLNRRNPS